jgi:hypothetical protein
MLVMDVTARRVFLEQDILKHVGARSLCLHNRYPTD